MTNSYYEAAKLAMSKIDALEGGWKLAVLAADSLRDVTPFPSRITTRDLANVISQMKYMAENRGMPTKYIHKGALSTSTVHGWCDGMNLFANGKSGINLGYPSKGEIKVVLWLALELEDDMLFSEEEIDELSEVIYEHAKKKRFSQ